MTEANGETLVWAEMSDGELWIDCCIPLSLVEQYNRCAVIALLSSFLESVEDAR